MKFPPAMLEDWMRQAYFAAEFDIGSSGVENYRLSELRELIGLSLAQLDEVIFHDSHTLGGDRLRKAIADRYAGGQVERVMATHGSTEANFLVHSVLIRPGDQVVALAPAYQQLWSLAAGSGASVRMWPLRVENHFRPDLDDLRRVVAPDTRAIIVNFPQNPTGATLSHDGYLELVKIADRVGAWLIWDAAFSELVHTAPPLPDPTAEYPRAVSMGTLSKAYGLPGLRVGWCIAPIEILTQLVRVRDYVSLHLSPLVELIASGAVACTDQIVADRLAKARANLAICEQWAREQGDRVDWIPPQGGVTAFPRIDVPGGTDQLCQRLLERRVLAVPGSCFGCRNHLRLGFGGPQASLKIGLQHLAELLATP